jgi:hypothetical protein
MEQVKDGSEFEEKKKVTKRIEEDEFVILRFFSSESEAHIVSALLTKEGVPNFLSSQLMNQLLPLGNGAISMHVRLYDRERAIELLHEFEWSQLHNLDDIEIDLSEGKIVYQPKIQQKDPYYKVYIILIVAITLILLVQAIWGRAIGFSLY